MDFRFTAEEQLLRQEVRRFLEQELPADWAGLWLAEETEEFWDFTREFTRKLGRKGWLAISWPQEFGGQGRSVMDEFLCTEEMAYHRAPGWGGFGVTIIGPTIMLCGSESQKREFLPKIASGEIEFCLGYSEPGAGSDLASVQLRAVADGDDYVLSGQKSFTSLAHLADYCWLAARTDPEAPKHKGISLFVVPIKTPGITIRPLVDMAGVRTFNDVFFDDVRIPKTCLVGEPNRGWYYLAVALDLERSPNFVFFPISWLRPTFDELVQYTREAGVSGRPLARHRLAELAIELEVGRMLSYRVAWMLSKGLIANYEASIVKLYSTELAQRLANTGMRLLGLYGQLELGSKWAPLKGRIERAYLSSVCATIGAGTSEIQRGIIAMRGLGLPRG